MWHLHRFCALHLWAPFGRASSVMDATIRLVSRGENDPFHILCYFQYAHTERAPSYLCQCPTTASPSASLSASPNTVMQYFILLWLCFLSSWQHISQVYFTFRCIHLYTTFAGWFLFINLSSPDLGNIYMPGRWHLISIRMNWFIVLQVIAPYKTCRQKGIMVMRSGALEA